MVQPEESLMIRSFLAVSVLAFGIGSVMAQSDPIATRKDTMKKVGQANAEVTKIAKGDTPFKLETIQAALKTMDDASKAMPKLFPEDSKSGGDTAAQLKIWEAKADFDSRWEKFGKDAVEAAGKIKDEASFKAAYGDVVKNCGGCHESYRVKK
jgi:cytochrome c556